MRIGIRIGKPVTKTFEQIVGDVVKAVLDIEEMRKAGGYKYVKREGTSGHYKYWYRLPNGSLGSREDLIAAKKGKKLGVKKLGIRKPGNGKMGTNAGTEKDAVTGNESGKQIEGRMQRPQGLGLRKPGQGNGDNGNGTGFVGSVAVGDIIIGKDEHYDGSITGKVTRKGKDGVTVESKNGVIHKIRWDGVEKVNKPVNPQDAIRALYDQAAIVGGWRGGDDGMQPESCDTIGGLLKAAESDRENLNKITKEYADIFADLSPILIKRPVLKGIERIKEKLREDEKKNFNDGLEPGEFYDAKTDAYHCRTIRDTDGHTLVFSSIADLAKVFVAFDKDKRAIRIKNNFLKPSPLGYSDINLNVRLPNGSVAEIQLNTTANLVAKETIGHSLYEVYRTLNSADKTVKEKHAELLELMVDGQKALYGKANEFSKEGTYKLSDSVQSEINNGNTGAIFKEENPEYAAIVKPFVEKALPLLEKAVKEGLFPENEKGEENKAIGHFRELAERLKKA